MSEDYTALVVEARTHVGDFDVEKLDVGAWPLTMSVLADAVESLQAERDEFKREMESRELHHFEVETENAQLRDIIERAKGVTHSSSVPLGVTEARHWDRLLAETQRILSEADTALRERATEEERERVLRDMLSYRYLPEDVREYIEAYLEADTAPREDRALRAEPDYSYIYWRDPVEGCWVAYQRADCVGDEELPTQKLPMEGGSHG